MRRRSAVSSLSASLLVALLGAAPPSQAAQNLLQDGGFEQFLDQPDERGNPFKAWSGWKWVHLFGSGRIWFDDLRLEKIEGPAPRPGLTLGEVEETFHDFTGAGGLTCPSCGLKADPAAAKCAVCGEHAEVVQKTLDFARNGGQVVLLPNSWFFDQYNRKQDYLAQLGIQVTSMKAPKLAKGQSRSGLTRDAAGEETEAPFLMGLVTDTVVSDVPRAPLKTLPGAVLPLPAALVGAGVRHVLKVGPANKVLATFPDDHPALVRVPVGQGAVYYLGIPLVPASMAELMNAVLAAGGLSRPVRFLTPGGAHVTGLEYRAIKTADGWLAYVNNLDRRNDKRLKLETGLKLSGIRNPTLETDSPLSFTLPAGETYILRLNANQSK